MRRVVDCVPVSLYDGGAITNANRMKNKTPIIVIAVVVLAIVGMWAGGVFQRESAEESAEKAIEKATGEDVDIDLDGETVRINTNEGTFTSGTSVDLPDDFPDDIYVADGTIISAASNGEMYSIMILSDDSVAEVKQQYEDALATDGWEVTLEMTVGTGAMVSAEKGDLTVTVNIGEDTEQGKTTVLLNTSEIIE